MQPTITLISIFEESEKTAEAIDDLCNLGISESAITVMTGVPYPEQALGRHTEWIRLPYIVLIGAFCGLLFGVFLSVVTPLLYPLSVGGRSIVTGPPAMIIIFVFTMMATIVSIFLGVIWEMGFPSFEKKYYDVNVTSGKMAVLIDCSESIENEVRDILKNRGASDIDRPTKVEV